MHSIVLDMMFAEQESHREKTKAQREKRHNEHFSAAYTYQCLYALYVSEFTLLCKRLLGAVKTFDILMYALVRNHSKEKSKKESEQAHKSPNDMVLMEVDLLVERLLLPSEYLDGIHNQPYMRR